MGRRGRERGIEPQGDAAKEMKTRRGMGGGGQGGEDGDIEMVGADGMEGLREEGGTDNGEDRGKDQGGDALDGKEGRKVEGGNIERKRMTRAPMERERSQRGGQSKIEKNGHACPSSPTAFVQGHTEDDGRYPAGGKKGCGESEAEWKGRKKEAEGLNRPGECAHAETDTHAANAWGFRTEGRQEGVPPWRPRRREESGTPKTTTDTVTIAAATVIVADGYSQGTPAFSAGKKKGHRRASTLYTGDGRSAVKEE
ncbi:hypothetical protein C8J57DRAFT_1664759 [Mycena rebaudengoi]|nr:hypothetical protein C8J57DRAFT_1664759 [Mycena rebaudengoi]